MNKKTIHDIDLQGKTILARLDWNVPIENGEVTDPFRINATRATLEYLWTKDCKIIITSHMGRPDGQPNPKFGLEPAARKASQIYGRPVKFVPDCVGSEVKAATSAMQPGDMILLENVRFHPEEEKNDPAFAQQLAALCDVYVNDAFGAAHRAHASTEGMARIVPKRAAGFLMKKEVEALSKITQSPDRPLVAILGGAKVSDKSKVVDHLIDKVDGILIGGAMAYTFLRAQGFKTGSSRVEEEMVGVARAALDKALQRGVRILLPIDHLVTTALDGSAPAEVTVDIPAGKKGVDIGPASIVLYKTEIGKARTLFWNGPMGIFEVDAFSKGTMAIADAMAESQALTVVGGGDSIAALSRSGRSDDITHISTGSGASLEFLEGRELPGLAVLEQ